MAGVKCPIDDCDYSTPEGTETAVIVALMSIHALVHTSGGDIATKPMRVKRPEVASAGTTGEWNYFLSRWKAYAKATKLKGEDIVIQLLECCSEELRMDMTKNLGGASTLEEMTEEQVLAAMKPLAARQ